MTAFGREAWTYTAASRPIGSKGSVCDGNALTARYEVTTPRKRAFPRFCHTGWEIAGGQSINKTIIDGETGTKHGPFASLEERAS
jgi:hypothetical protein